jgi:hypothetical protein
MSGDRELLGLAAKAAGYEIEWGIVEEGRVIAPPTEAYKRDKYGIRWKWDPKNDAGDALRLAVKVGLAMRTRGDGEAVVAWREEEPSAMQSVHYSYERDGGIAMCLAIVRAAAEIGKAKP